MNESPDHPPGEPAQTQSMEVDHGAEPPDGSGGAEVTIGEGDDWFVPEPPHDGVGGVQPALHGHLSHPRQIVESHHVANYEHLGVPGQGQVR